MKKTSSQPTIKALKKIFGWRFEITTEARNKFCFDGTSYQPDLVFRNKKNDKIEAIIEVEQGTRKHVVGGVITADFCMGNMKQQPVMLILALAEQDRKDYAKRIKMLKSYVKNIKDIIVGDKTAVIRALEKINE